MTSERLADYPAASARRSENSLEQISFPYPFFFFAVQNIQRNFEVPGAPCCVIKQGIEGMERGAQGKGRPAADASIRKRIYIRRRQCGVSKPLKERVTKEDFFNFILDKNMYQITELQLQIKSRSTFLTGDGSFEFYNVI